MSRPRKKRAAPTAEETAQAMRDFLAGGGKIKRQRPQTVPVKRRVLPKNGGVFEEIDTCGGFDD